MFKGKKILILVFTFIVFIGMMLPALVRAQAYWTAMPPYNVLWPLWSPALSPGGTPLITSLTKNTILPVQPGLVWNPTPPAGLSIPWPIYNAPATLGGGLLYFDLYYGLNPWPPSYMLNSATGAPAPLTPPVGYSALLPTALKNYGYLIPLANSVFSYQYGVPLTSLLTASSIWGLPTTI